MQAYVYSISIDGVVRYIGKGRGRRAGSHVKLATQINLRRADGEIIRTTRFYNALAKALANEAPVSGEIIEHGLSDEDAFRLEVQLIANAPDGQLYNSAEGGRGLTAKVAKQIWNDPSYREVQRTIGQKARLAGLWAKPGFRERKIEFSKNNMARLWADPNYRAMRTKVVKDQWRDPAFRARKSKHNREIAVANNARPEKRRQQSALAARLNADQQSEFNERRVNGLRIAFQVRRLRRLLERMREERASNG